jgi:hypothetical protein
MDWLTSMQHVGLARHVLLFPADSNPLLLSSAPPSSSSSYCFPSTPILLSALAPSESKLRFLTLISLDTSDPRNNNQREHDIRYRPARLWWAADMGARHCLARWYLAWQPALRVAGIDCCAWLHSPVHSAWCCCAGKLEGAHEREGSALLLNARGPPLPPLRHANANRRIWTSGERTGGGT